MSPPKNLQNSLHLIPSPLPGQAPRKRRRALPGETILVAAALLAATINQVDIAAVVAAAATGAIIGDGIGYTVGRRSGRRFFANTGDT